VKNKDDKPKKNYINISYDDMIKECLNLRERIAKLESEKTLIKA
jgi:hypothetical protein